MFRTRAERLIAFVRECDNPTCSTTVILSAQYYGVLASGDLVLHNDHRAA
jgi:hypothetical protein